MRVELIQYEVIGTVAWVALNHCFDKVGEVVIDETLTFLPASGGGYVLEQVVLRYLDRRAPEADDVVRTLTPADFGSVRFEEVVLDALYKLQE